MQATEKMVDYRLVDQATPAELVRRYRDLHVIGSHQRLTDSEHIELLHIVNELRNRRILD